MAFASITDAVLLVGGYDLSGSSNHVDIDVEVGENDMTNFRSGGWSEKRAALYSATISAAGFFQAGSDGAGGSYSDDVLGTNLGVTDTPLTVCTSATDGSVAWFTKSVEGRYSWGGDVGDALPWDAEFMSSGRMVRGTLIHPPNTARTSSSTGTGRQLTTVSSTQTLYAVLHVLAISGTSTPTLTVLVQRDDNSGFTTPTTAVSFTAATAVGSQWATVAGPITPDDRYRVSYTITGTNPSFMFAVAVGIA